jgi:hypothetical protein
MLLTRCASYLEDSDSDSDAAVEGAVQETTAAIVQAEFDRRNEILASHSYRRVIEGRSVPLDAAATRRAEQELSVLRAQNNGYGVDYCHSPLAVARMPAALLDSEDEFMNSCQKTLDRSRASSEKAKTFRAELLSMKAGTDSDSEATTINGQDEFSFDTQSKAERDFALVEDAGRAALARDDVQVLGSIVISSKKGRCEALFHMKEGSLPDLIAMCQGLESVEDDSMFPGLVFDLEIDER